MPTLTSGAEGSILCLMADEKPKEPLSLPTSLFSEYLKRLRTPHLGAGTKILMEGERDPKLDEVIKLLAEKGRTVNAQQLADFLEALGVPRLDSSQTRAEETAGQVETAVGPPIPIDPSMTVDKTKVAQWLDAHWQSPTRTAKACLVCGQTKWAIADAFTWMAMVGSGGSLQIGGDYYPFVPLACTICGNTLFFNARVMGLLPLKKREGE